MKEKSAAETENKGDKRELHEEELPQIVSRKCF
jgi:hypothetical protein